MIERDIRIGIISGYFAGKVLHDGHKEYIDSAIKKSDILYVIIQSDEMLDKKYPNYNHSSSNEIAEMICDYINNYINSNKGRLIQYIILVNDKKTVAKKLKEVAKNHKGGNITFFKDGDRNLKSLPKKEIIELYKNNIKFKFFGNKKIDSSKNFMSKRS